MLPSAGNTNVNEPRIPQRYWMFLSFKNILDRVDFLKDNVVSM